ncbi:MAG: biotin--[acetyl-CoA-carboxylase] ligase, partial [Bacteroides sp.]|nr:biotin--[acetyl-CoA-carboxylase] ligase [Bacteroides sp.]
MINFHEHPYTEISTQDIGKALPVMADDAGMEVVYTFCQQQGRGQKGNVWFGGQDSNICATFVFTPRFLDAAHLFFLDMALSIGVLRYAGSQTERVFLKWPNDLYVDRKKLAGLLLESSIQAGKLERVCFGVGLNVNQREFPTHLPRAVSLFQTDGKMRNLQEEIRQLAETLYATYAEFRNSYAKGIWRRWKERYLEHLLFKDQWREF